MGFLCKNPPGVGEGLITIQFHQFQYLIELNTAKLKKMACDRLNTFPLEDPKQIAETMGQLIEEAIIEKLEKKN